MTPQGALTTLTSLTFGNGWDLFGGLVQATDGNLYGTGFFGGNGTNLCPENRCGTIFKVTPGGALTRLHSFDNTGGEYPQAGLLQATNGTLYGVASAGGTNHDGTVFSLSVNLGPFVKTLPASGKVGTRLGILGNNLAGATSVSFNGTTAGFTVNSTGTAISTTVPGWCHHWAGRGDFAERHAFEQWEFSSAAVKLSVFWFSMGRGWVALSSIVGITSDL